MRMKPPTVVFQRRHEGIEAAPDTEIGRRRRGLHLPHLFDQHLAVVQAAQPLLIALGVRKCGVSLPALDTSLSSSRA